MSSISSNGQKIESRVEIFCALESGGEVPITLDVTYKASDPYTLGFVFHSGCELVEWQFGRDLIKDGLHRRTGEGDVVVWPGSGEYSSSVFLRLSSPSGTATFRVFRPFFTELMDKCFALVPEGCEAAQLNIDKELRDLLSGN